MKNGNLKDRAAELERNSFYQLFENLVDASEELQSINPSKRRAWLSHVIEDLYDAQDGKCAICGSELEYGAHDVDHVIPHSFGGGNERSNLQLACKSCNRSKRNAVSAKDLLNYLEDKASNL